MKILITFLLASASVFAADSSPVVDPNKWTVCAITINSDDEKKVFQSQISKFPKKFNPIVELTELGDSDNWFKNACSSGIRCDQLVISGHFDNKFYGDHNNLTLPLKEIEAAGCSKTCENILAKPYEVFLFGCNTLATKAKDSRTPQQYLQVLLEHGTPLAQAEVIVEARYGKTGDTNKSSMQRAFMGENKNIYGFDAKGPLGKNIKKDIENYFSKVPLPERLEKLQAQRMMNQVVTANKQIAQNFKKYAFDQCETGAKNDEVTKNICKLFDKTTSLRQKLDHVVGLFGREDYLTYFPSINAFLMANPPEKLPPEMRKDLEVVTGNAVVKNQILDLLHKTDSLGLKQEWGQLALNLGFLKKDEFLKMINEEVGKFFKKPMTVAEKDGLCGFRSEYSLEISSVDGKQLSPSSIDALNCLHAFAPDVRKSVGDIFLTTSDPKLRNSAMEYLWSNKAGEFQPVTPEESAKLKELITVKDDVAKGVYLKALYNSDPNDPDVMKLTEKLISEKSKGLEQALSIYTERRSADPVMDMALTGILQTSNDVKINESAISALMKGESREPSVKDILNKKLKDKKINQYLKEEIVEYLKQQ